MNESDLVRILQGTADFAGVGAGALTGLIGAGSVVEPAVGSDIIRQGEPGRHVWILIEGELDILVHGAPVNHLSRPGEVVGQISAVSFIPATATVRIAAPSKCLSIPQPSLHGLFAAHPDLAEALLRSMTKYLGAP